VPQLTPLLLAIAAGGLYFCVPDTEAPMVLLGALLATGFVVLVPGLPPTRGFVALTGLFVWAAAYGGFARGGSVVGGIACLGVVLLGVLVARCARSTRGVVLVVLVQAALVAFVSRVAGFEQGTATAVVLALVAFVVAAGALALVAARVRVTRAPT